MVAYLLERAEVRTDQHKGIGQASKRHLQPGKVRTYQEMETKQASKRHLHAREGRGQDWSGHRNKGHLLSREVRGQG